MSDLTMEQLHEFREKLLASKESIDAALHQSAGERPIEASGSTIGRLSRMDAMQVQAMAQLGRRQHEIKLLRVDAALAALDAGMYGTCRECKEPISLKRLEALPEAPFCVPCQEGFEA